MAEYQVTGTFVGRDARPLRKALGNLGVNARVTKVNQHPSRAARFSEALDRIRHGQEDLVELRDELQTWRDNLPENLEDGQKAEQLDIAIDQLTEFEEIEGDVDVDFPTMF